MLTYILFFLGFIALIKGADFLVSGASSIAKKFNVSDLMIGLTIVAFGTSAPELIVNIIASIQGTADIAIGNVLGSNIANILLILGVAAFIYPMKVTRGTVWKEIPLSLLAVIIIFFVANDMMIDHMSFSKITRIDGLVLISFFAIFIYYTFGIAKTTGTERTDVKTYSLPISIGLIILGGAGLAFGGQWIIEGATTIAKSFGLSESLIGLTIIAIGTSLPELATSAVAAFKKSADIAVGNIVGSNIFNLFWVLGISSIISPMNFNLELNFDIYVCIAITVFLLVAMFVGKRQILEKWQGALMVAAYVVYITFSVVKG